MTLNFALTCKSFDLNNAEITPCKIVIVVVIVVVLNLTENYFSPDQLIYVV